MWLAITGPSATHYSSGASASLEHEVVLAEAFPRNSAPVKLYNPPRSKLHVVDRPCASRATLHCGDSKFVYPAKDVEDALASLATQQAQILSGGKDLFPLSGAAARSRESVQRVTCRRW
jgi:hypothetical protein